MAGGTTTGAPKMETPEVKTEPAKPTLRELFLIAMNSIDQEWTLLRETGRCGDMSGGIANAWLYSRALVHTLESTREQVKEEERRLRRLKRNANRSNGN